MSVEQLIDFTTTSIGFLNFVFVIGTVILIMIISRLCETVKKQKQYIDEIIDWIYTQEETRNDQRHLR